MSGKLGLYEREGGELRVESGELRVEFRRESSTAFRIPFD